MNHSPAILNSSKLGWLLIAAAWLMAVGFTVPLVALQAQRGGPIDPVLLLLFNVNWIVSLALVACGTYRVTGRMANKLRRRIVVALAVVAQCVAYYLLLPFLAIYVYLAAGGSI